MVSWSFCLRKQGKQKAAGVYALTWSDLGEYPSAYNQQEMGPFKLGYHLGTGITRLDPRESKLDNHLQLTNSVGSQV